MAPEEQTSASDEGQVKKAERRDKFSLQNETSDIREVMSTPAGRRMMWALLAKCGVFESIYENTEFIRYRSGQQDIGHWLIGRIMESDPDLWLEMQSEAATQGDKTNAGRRNRNGDSRRK